MSTAYPAPARALVERLSEQAAADPSRACAFQGAPGAYSHQAVRERLPGWVALPCPTFEDAMEAVTSGRVARAMIPVENNLHGRVADVHVLLPESGLTIIGEHEVKVEHCLLSLPGAPLSGLRRALSHPQALGQTRRRLRELGIEPVAASDTAASAALIVEAGDPAASAVASRLAGELYGCDIALDQFQDHDSNATRFLVLARTPIPVAQDAAAKTMLHFQVKNIPAALFKALGGFATNGVNLTRLESHLRGAFEAAEFLIDIEGRPADPPVARALEELAFHSRWVRVIGTWAK